MKGIVRTNLNATGTSYNKGFPVVGPLGFGQPVTLPKNFGNPIPAVNAANDTNPVTWTPSPNHFGNILGV